ncbi:NUDIX hydrolase [Bartonella tamiae]|uniref:Nudix hydrolase domain-containing protein n=1 Tax=Bartonella tamiae Th239 TaxID=1094558 RepID=J0R034_9HYPH|nr:NUDIX hydrolase [Bartonella tamiae]EJF88864.1 hypothetical protein ME5_01415 [Bartonella tamiae Th239]EJF94886.1 hypothetical protein MEG_00467 [Bartonella tamiae Th307]
MITSDIANDKRIIVDGDRFLQVGGLVYRINENNVEYLTITSRGTGRWIIPKGWPIPGMTLPQAALREAYEEAGIRGIVKKSSLGSYHYTKLDLPPGENGNFKVYVYAIYYSHQEKKWPERGQRIFEWVSPQVAAKRVAEPQLKDILLKYNPL